MLATTDVYAQSGNGRISILAFLYSSTKRLFWGRFLLLLPTSDDVTITPSILTGGVFQGVTIAADADLSVFIPYLIMNKDTGFVQNSTVVDIEAGESVLLNVLAPPRTDTAVIQIGEFGRENWPIRNVNESWRTWYNRGGYSLEDSQGISRISGVNGTIDAVQFSTENGGGALAITVSIERPHAAAYTESEGGRGIRLDWLMVELFTITCH